SARLSVIGRPARAAGRLAARLGAGLVPGASTNLIEGISGPLDDVERISADDRGGTLLGHHVLDPVGPVGGDVADLATPAGPRFFELVEKAAQGRFGLARGGPHQTPRAVIDHHGQVLMALLITDLVDADPA